MAGHEYDFADRLTFDLCRMTVERFGFLVLIDRAADFVYVQVGLTGDGSFQVEIVGPANMPPTVGWDAGDVATFQAAGFRICGNAGGNLARSAHSPAAACLLVCRALDLVGLPICDIAPVTADGQTSATVEWLAWHQANLAHRKEP